MEGRRAAPQINHCKHITISLSVVIDNMPQMMPMDVKNNLKYSFKAIFKEPLVGDNLSAGIWRHIGCIFKFGEEQTSFGKGDFH